MDKSSSKSGALIFILVSLVGLALAIFAANNALNAYKAKSWPTTQGTVIYSQVEGSSRYIPKITYTYTIGTNEISSDKIGSTTTTQYRKKEDAAKVTAEYPVNSKVTVYYNPTKVDEAFLVPGIKGEHFFMFFLGLIIFLAPLTNFIFTSRKSGEGNKTE